MTKTIAEVYSDLKSRFLSKTGIDIEAGTAIDGYVLSSAEGIQLAYQEIENNKKPYMFTEASGDELDSWGALMRLPRRVGESDINYSYRLTNGHLIKEASNATAIQSEFLNNQYISNAKYVPKLYGCGTAGLYIIPTDYSEDTKANALAEAQLKIKNSCSPGTYVKYIFPELKRIKLAITMKATGDVAAIKSQLDSSVESYLNSIPTAGYLEVGEVNKIGINTANVEYFNVNAVFVEGSQNNNIEILQTIDIKFVFDEIIWLEV
jgi:hypothetical protein